MDLLFMARHGFLAGAIVALCFPFPDWGAPAGQAAEATLSQGFQNVPVNSRPWVYWWWHNGNVTKESITRDLEQMKAKGIGGFLMFDSRGYHQHYLPPPPPKNEFLDPQWRALVKFSMEEAHRLGLQMSMNLSTHAGSLHAPWNMGDNRPKKLVWTASEVSGPRRVSIELPAGTGDARAWEVALFAVRRSHAAPATGAAGSPTVSLSGKWRDIATEVPKEPGAPVTEVLDLTKSIGPNGALSWDVPAGEWTLLRFAYVIIPGFDTTVDVLNRKAIEEYFNRVAGPILKDAGPLAGRTLTYFYSVSWEGASPTWTPGFEAEFLKYRGYSPMPYLPVFAGMTVKSAEESGRFLADYSRALGDCFMNNCYGKLQELSSRHGIKWHAESGGPWGKDLFFQQSDQFEFWARNDMPQGEFWPSKEVEPPIGTTRANTRRTAMAAHTYGKPIVATEAFTHMLSHWIMYPARLKPSADDVFIDGANQFIWHTFSASPKEFGVPGIVYWAGTHLNPNVTWWEQSGAFLDYLARCQFMLRQGHPVNDVVCYASSRNRSAWGHDEKWNDSPSLVLPKGYKHDVISKEALIERLSVKDGKPVLPGGLSYRLLVVDLDEDVIAPEVLEKIDSLANAGATVVLGRRRPTKAFGLKDYPASDAKVRQLASQLWGDAGGQPFRKTVGRGVVIGGVAMDEVLKKEEIAPDFEGPFQFTHRRTAGMDIYFVSGEGTAECIFRVRGLEPEFWDPVTGRFHRAQSYRPTADGRMATTISLPRYGSVFVVFHKRALPAERRPLAGPKRPAAPLELTGSWSVHFPPGWGAPESETFATLLPWNEYPLDGIKYFSGTATYRKTFTLSAAQVRHSSVKLSLGEVKHIASVRLNGKSLGIVWTAPWTVNLAGAAKAGENVLEIDVTNVWVNRLIGDAGLPEAKRFTKTHVRREPGVQYPRPSLRGYLATDPLVRSGLMGPVTIEFADRDTKY